jgi:hypothetical protein
MHGPPMYFTPDWISARTSVQSLAALSPEVVVTGHGQTMQGQEMRAALHELAERFDEIAVPETGRYTLKQDRSSVGRSTPNRVALASLKEP